MNSLRTFITNADPIDVTATIAGQPISVTGTVYSAGEAVNVIGPVGDLSGESLFTPTSPTVTAVGATATWTNVNSTWNKVSAATMTQRVFAPFGAYPYLAFGTSRPTTPTWSGQPNTTQEFPFCWRFDAWSQGSNAIDAPALIIPDRRLVVISTTAVCTVHYAPSEAGPYSYAYTTTGAAVRGFFHNGGVGAIRVTVAGTDPLDVTRAANVYLWSLSTFNVAQLSAYIFELEETNPATQPVYPMLLSTTSNALANRSATIANAAGGYSQQYPLDYDINT